MKRLVLFMFISMIFFTFSNLVYGGQSVFEEDHSHQLIEKENTEEVMMEADHSIIENKDQITSEFEMTATRHTPWWVQLHITSPQEVKAGVKGGEGAQRTWGLALSSNNPDYFLRGTDTCGLWKSNDGGKTWFISEGQPILQGSIDVAIHPDDKELQFVAVSPNRGLISKEESKYSGIWKSEDYGKTWEQVLEASFYRYKSGNLIAFGKLNSNRRRNIYVATHNNGIYKSTDNGKNWENIGLENTIMADIYIDKAESRIVTISEETGVMVAAKDNLNWQKRNKGLSNIPQSMSFELSQDGTIITDKDILGATSIAVNPENNQHWFIATRKGVYESIDAGALWRLLPKPAGLWNARILKIAFGAPNDNDNPRLYLQAHRVGNNFRYSDDLGKTWNAPEIHTEMTFFDSFSGYFYDGMVVHPTDPKKLWVIFNSVLFKSEDGGENFYPSNQGFSGLRASDFYFNSDDTNKFYIAAIDYGVIKTIDPGIDDVYPMFKHLTSNEDRYEGARTVHSIARNPQNQEHLIKNIGHWGINNILAQSFDGGETWEHIPGTEEKTLKGIWFHPQQPSIIYTGKNYSSDGGKTWEVLPKMVMAVSPIDGDIVYAIDNNRLYKSKDRGVSWELMEGTRASFSPLPPIQRVVPDLFEKDKLWLGTRGQGIIVIDKDGDEIKRTIIEEEQGLIKSEVSGEINISDIAQNPDDPEHLVAGGRDTKAGASPGLFETRDGGETWYVVPGMPGIRDIWKIAFHPQLPKIFTGTSAGTWVYEYKFFEVN